MARNARTLLRLLGALLTVAAAVLPASALAQSPSPSETPTPAGTQTPPELVFMNPEDGAVVREPVFVFQLCYAEPINIRDLPDGGDFDFSLTGPDGIGLGSRIVFQVDGYGVAVYPGPPPGETEGEWTFTWRVTSPDASQAHEGEITYTVDPDGDPVPSATPPACVGESGTATPPGEETPAPSGAPSATEPPENGGAVDEDDDGPDILLLALLTVGAAGGAALIAIIGYFVRRAIGYDPHRPTGGGDTGEHH